MNRAIGWAERGLVPDTLVRFGIRELLRRQLAVARRDGPAGIEAAKRRLRAELEAGPVTVHADDANRQHYEVPAGFFEIVLGPRLKYSSCLWGDGAGTLAAAEEAMLDLTCRRARLEDGMDVLDLGCGWGSLTLWIAERYPRCRITAVSNSAGQRAHIEARCARLGYANVRVITADIAEFEAPGRFDRVISVEMLEHVRNHAALFGRIARWLAPGGLLFTHVFAHREIAYLYETGGGETWMARHFFTGGMMPSGDWLAGCDRDLEAVAQWRVSGVHYARTLEARLRRLDASRDDALDTLRRAGEPDAALQLRRWRIFLMACAELFDYRGGTEWFVSHTLHAPRMARRSRSRLAVHE